MSAYDRIRVLWPDHLGLARGKYLPIRYAEQGAFHCMALFSLGYDREMTPAPGTKMLEGLPDLKATFDMDEVRDGWEPRTGVVVADISFQGAPVGLSSRRAIAAWEALGYRPKIGIELEAYILQRSDDGSWVPWETPGGFKVLARESRTATGCCSPSSASRWATGAAAACTSTCRWPTTTGTTSSTTRPPTTVCRRSHTRRSPG